MTIHIEDDDPIIDQCGFCDWGRVGDHECRYCGGNGVDVFDRSAVLTLAHNLGIAGALAHVARTAPRVHFTSRLCGAARRIQAMLQRLTPIVLILALTAIAGCAGTWGGPDRPRAGYVTPLYVASSALVACDAGQTLWMSHGGRYDRMSRPGYQLAEMNPILGREPSQGLLVGIALANVVGGYAVLKAPVPDWLKGLWFGAITAVESYTVAGNAKWTGACGVVGTRENGFVEAAR